MDAVRPLRNTHKTWNTLDSVVSRVPLTFSLAFLLTLKTVSGLISFH